MRAPVLCLTLVAWTASPVDAQSPSAEAEQASETAGSSESEGVTEVDPARMPVVDADDTRELPSYDGREEAPMSAGEVLLWIPRVLLAPLYFVAEYVLRRPLGLLVSSAEKAELVDRVSAFFQFGPDNNLALVPTLNFDLGFRFNAGLYFRWNELFHENNKLRYYIVTGGSRWISTAIADRFTTESYELEVRGAYLRRADGMFWEVGGQASDAIRSRFSWEQVDAEIAVRTNLWRQSQVELTSGVRWARFDNDPFRGPSVQDRVEEGVLPALPAGFNCDENGEDCGGYMIHRTRAELTIDSRKDRPESQSGVRFSAGGEVAYDIRQGPGELLWVEYGGALEGFVDLTGDEHVASLALGVNFADPLRGEIPFQELPQLSGDGPMIGFLPNALLGESEISATLTYDWPIWVLLDGTMHVAVGNSFGHHLAGFDWDKLRMSFGVGVAAIDDTDHFFEVQVGFGTSTFEDGARIDSFRFFFGGKRAF